MALKFGFTAAQIIQEGRLQQSDIDELRTWLLQQKELPNLQNEQIVLFLLSCNNDQKATRNTIVANYKTKRSSPRYFTKRDVDTEIFEIHFGTTTIASILPCTDEGDAIILFKMPEKASELLLDPAVKVSLMELEAILIDYPPRGLIIVLDVQKMGFMHVTRLRYGPIKTFITYLQEGLPLQLKQIHMLNVVSCVDKFMRIISPLLKPHVNEMIKYHPKDVDMNEVYKKLPKRCLPEDYGGDLRPVAVMFQELRQKLRKLKPYFEAEERQWLDAK